MADEEQKTETTAPAGEPKPAEMSASVTKKTAPKKKAPAKKAPAKKAAAKKAAPAAATVTPSEPKAAPAAPRRRYTPPPKSIWWQALIFIAIIVYAFSLIRNAARAPQAETAIATTPSQSTTDEGAMGMMPAAETAQPATPEVSAPPVIQMPMPAMPSMPPMSGMNGGPGSAPAIGYGSNGRDMGAMPPPPPQMNPNAMPPAQPQMNPNGMQSMQPMQHPYGMPAYPQQGYGFYGPGGWYGMPYQYQPQSMPSN
jgi:hypothetical protein